jgi:hypothetical protein
MSLRDSELTRSRRPSPTKSTETKRQRERRLAKGRAERRRLRQKMRADDDAVLSFKEWCRLNGFSERQGRRILRGPNRPVITQLSSRIGIRRRDNRQWQEQQTR